MTLLQVGDAQARLRALKGPLPVEEVDLAAAAGRWAAADVVARRTQPAADLSAMDGYALRFADLAGPLAVVGESKAGGSTPHALGPGEAVRIFTGAALPAGADTILIQEEAARDGDVLRLTGAGPAARGTHVRARGMDFAEGDRLIASGAGLTPARIALAAIGGHGTLPVRRRPRVRILSTGDELAPPGAGDAAMLPASNGPMLAAMLRGTCAIVHDDGILPDRIDALAAGFARAAADADIVVTTGGASVGDHDLVRPALVQAGAAIDFWRVAMRPGKPLMAGRLGDALVLGLPGNPVSAFVTARLFLLPLVAHLAGDPEPWPRPARMPLGAPLPAVTERTDYLRGRIVDGIVQPLVEQDSAALAMLARAEVLIVRPGRTGPAAPGDMVDILSID